MCSKVKDFLTDDDFINYALGVTPEAASQWETYFREHPEQIADAEEARPYYWLRQMLPATFHWLKTKI